MVDEFNAVDQLTSNFDSKLGFPAYRVFVYGIEISADVINVSVNNSGGSATRSAGTCTFTLYNPMNKYSITQNDMISIKNAQTSVLEKYPEYEKDQLLNDEDIWGESSSNPSESLSLDVLLEEASSLYVDNNGIRLDKSSVEALALKLSEGSTDIQRTLEALGFSNLTPESSSSLAGYIVGKYLRSKKPKELYLNPAEELVDTNTVKTDVVRNKLKHINKFGESAEKDSFIVFSYPYQQGDCIFHSNDPVRVVFRDPFNPSRWYWKFSGFIDTSTFDEGPNRDSRLTISCTDVSKIPRYASVVLDGLKDSSNPVLLTDILSPTENTSANAGLVVFNNIFRNLTILEILETIFFGYTSSTSLIKTSEDALAETVAQAINSADFNDVSEDEFTSYMTAITGMTVDEYKRILSPGSATEGLDISKDKFGRKQIKEKQQNKLTNLNDMKLPGVKSPRGVSFRRKDKNNGVNFFVYGEPDTYDKSLGATKINSFYDWNELLHHRVRSSDLVNMFNDGESDNYFADVTNERETNVEDVITIIGTDIEKYPVGGGNVFMLVPAGLESRYSVVDGAVLRDFGSPGMHSTFRDRLSYIYDLAEGIDFRFYTTPKGDVVFEIPMYDFDPDDFWNKGDITDDQLNKYLSGLSYEDVFQKEYDGDYDNISDLMDNVLTEVQTQLERDFIFRYEKEFSISVHEQLGFSVSNTDNGVVTAWRVQPNTIKNYASTNDIALETYQWAASPELVPMLGVRLGQGTAWKVIDTNYGAKLISELQLNRVNSEARSASISILPKFGLMVNRPIHWRSKNYYATIVSISDSISWNGGVTSQMELNHIRAWGGDMRDGKPMFKHFGNSNRPFNFAEFLSRAVRELGSKYHL